MDQRNVDITPAAGNGAVGLPATRDACQARLATLRDEIATLKAAIATADLERQARRGRTDPAWHAAQKAALRQKLRESADIAAHRTTLPRSREPLKDALIEVLRADYDDDAWQRVVAEARRRLVAGREDA